jgi:hypothetical protein
MLLYLTPEVREAALDLKALRKKVRDAASQAYRWIPAEANARQRLVSLSSEPARDSIVSAPRAKVSVPPEPIGPEAGVSPTGVVEDASSGTLFNEYVPEVSDSKRVSRNLFRVV